MANPNLLIGGNNYFDALIPSWVTIPYAVQGFKYSQTADPTSTTGMAGSFGIRKNGSVKITGVTRVDASGREQTDGYLNKIEIDLWQTDFNSLKNSYLLSKQLVCLAPELASGDWYNCIENTANPLFSGTTASPNGSCALGMEFQYELTTKDITNKLMFTGKMHPYEYDWLLANATSRVDSVTGSGVVTSSLSTMVYSQTSYGIPGINGMSVSGDNIGLFSEDTKITLKSVAPMKDTRERPISKFIEVEIDGKALQGRYYDQQAFTAKRNADFTVSVTGWNGITFNFVNCLSFVGSPDLSDTAATVPFKLKGKIAYDPNGVFTNIAFNGGTQTITFTRSVYQP